MRLNEVLRQPELGQDEEAAIYVERPWSTESEAIIVTPAPPTTFPVRRDGRSFDYFLEGFIARDFLDDLEESGDAAEMSEAQRHARLIRYAETDA